MSMPAAEGGGGSFPIQKFMLQIFAIIKGTSVMNFGTNPQHDFPKMRGGGQRPFGTFPKIHPFWSGDASLRGDCLRKSECLFMNQQKYHHDCQVEAQNIHRLIHFNSLLGWAVSLTNGLC